MKKLITLAIFYSALALSITSANSQTANNKDKAMIHSKITKADESHSFGEYKAVTEALQPYIESAKSGDGKLSRTAFYDHAHIVGSIGGEFYTPDADAFAKLVSEGGASPEIQHQIVWIDVSGPAAAAKVEFINWSGLRFTDFFVLYRHNGQWKISGKVYDSHSNN